MNVIPGSQHISTPGCPFIFLHYHYLRPGSTKDGTQDHDATVTPQSLSPKRANFTRPPLDPLIESTTTMSRAILAPIDANRRNGCELSPFLRGSIQTWAAVGLTREEIAKKTFLT